MRPLPQLLRLAPLLLLLAGGGCAAVPYSYTGELENRAIWRDRPQIETGRPNAFLDILGNVVSIPSKIILFSTRVDNHRVSPETVAAIETYLHRNDLANVKIRVNQYAPGGEWIRLFRNRSVGAGWRYTLGILTNVSYTIFPGRVFGGDHYNPFTNTISLYSDHPAIALHEAGHAKDFAQRTWKGTYAFTRLLPLVPLYQEGKATGDAVGYLRDRRETEKERNAYKILYPAYGTYIGGEVLNWVPVGQEAAYLIQVGAALPGHLVGRIKAAVTQDAPADAGPEVSPEITRDTASEAVPEASAEVLPEAPAKASEGEVAPDPGTSVAIPEAQAEVLPEAKITPAADSPAKPGEERP